MNESPVEVRRATRHAKKLLMFGVSCPICIDCSMGDIRCLCRRIGSPKNDQSSSPICCNCRCKRKNPSSIALNRKLKRYRDAGYPQPTCTICNESDLRTLELDHLAGEANSGLVGPLCANCHAMKSDDEQDRPIDLRRRDPDRSALVLQAAFDFGLAIILGAYAVAAWGEDDGQPTRAVFWGLIAAALVAWAIWDLAADEHFTNILGPGYDHAIAAPVPS
jgi:hypothetical protein